MKLEYQNKNGLSAGFDGISPPVYKARVTIPALEALTKAGATLQPLAPPQIGYRISLGQKMPPNIVAVHLNDAPHMGLRLESEQPYPLEFEDYWRQLDFTPCPVCQAPLVWYEAGFVPGYRICSQAPYHHILAR